MSYLSEDTMMGTLHLHQEIDSPKHFHALIDCLLQALDASHIDFANSQDFAPGSRSLQIFGNRLGLFLVSSDNTGVCAQMDQGSNLRTADGAVSACAKDHFVPEEVGLPNGREVLIGFKRHRSSYWYGGSSVLEK